MQVAVDSVTGNRNYLIIQLQKGQVETLVLHTANHCHKVFSHQVRSQLVHDIKAFCYVAVCQCHIGQGCICHLQVNLWVQLTGCITFGHAIQRDGFYFAGIARGAKGLIAGRGYILHCRDGFF